jgi:hypothetical protein
MKSVRKKKGRGLDCSSSDDEIRIIQSAKKLRKKKYEKTSQNRLYTDYKNIKLLGSGQFGKVYRADH